MVRPDPPPDDRAALLIFRVGPVLCCAPSGPVESIIMPPALNRPPGSSADRPGVFRHGRHVVNVIDLRQRFGVAETTGAKPGRLIITDLGQGLTGFWVDTIIDVETMPGTGWGNLPPLLPRGIFQRTLLREQQIHLYADFAALARIPQAGYLSDWIEQLDKADIGTGTAVTSPSADTPPAARDGARPRLDSELAARRAPGQGAKPAPISRPKSDVVAVRPGSGAAPAPARPARAGTRPATAARPGRGRGSGSLPVTATTPSRPTPAAGPPPGAGSGRITHRMPAGDSPRPGSDASQPPCTPAPASRPRVTAAPTPPPHTDNDGLPALVALFALLIGIGAFAWWGWNSLAPDTRTTRDRVSSADYGDYGTPTEITDPVSEAPAESPTFTELAVSASPEVDGDYGTPTEFGTPTGEFGTPTVPGEFGIPTVPPTATPAPTASPAGDNGLHARIERDAAGITIVLNAPVPPAGSDPAPEPRAAETDTASPSPATSNPHRHAEEPPVTPSSPARAEPVRHETVHVVVPGDTLWDIAARYIHNPFRYPELARLSKIRNPDLIYPGDRVRIIRYEERYAD